MNVGRSPRQTYKALLFDYDELLSKSDDECCYSLSEREVHLLLAQIDYIGWKTRYRPTSTEIDREVIDRWKGNLAEKLLMINCGQSVLTRQNPADYCQLQQSYDGGETWETVFDYSLCVGGEGTELYIIKLNQTMIINQYRLDTYTGTNTSIDPDAPTTNWDYAGDAAGRAALCNAVLAYVQEAMLAYYNKLLISIGAAAVTAGVLGWITGGVGAIVGGVVLLGIGITIAAVQLAINNRQAMDAVICQLTDQLEGRAATFAEWTDAINDIVTSSGDEATIKFVLQQGNTALANYLWFLAMIGEAKREVAGGIDNCPCGDTFCYYFSFATAGDEDWTLQTDGGYNNGIFVPGGGWAATDFVNTITNPDSGNRLTYIKRALSPRTITKIVMTYNFTGGTYDSNALRALFIALNGTDVKNITRAAMVNGSNLQVTWEGSFANVSNIDLFLRSSRDIAAPYTYSGIASIIDVRVEGIGSNPFGVDNCP